MPTCKLVILCSGNIYRSLSIVQIGEELLKVTPALRPTVLEILRYFDTNGLLVPTVHIDRKAQEVTLVYNGWVKGREACTLTVFFAEDNKIEYKYGNTMWIPSSLESIKKQVPRIMDYFRNARSPGNAAP